ncbi:hypothetical protein N7492_009761, partial [Penicillium capsulatum]
MHPVRYDPLSSRLRKSRSPSQRHNSKIIHGPLRSLCLPRICELESISSVILVRQESPWDTYRRALTCDIAGQVFIDERRSRPSRVVAIRQYPKSNAVRLVHIFGMLYPSGLNLHLSRRLSAYNGAPGFLRRTVPNRSGIIVNYVSGREDTFLGYWQLTEEVLHGFRYLSSLGFIHRSFSCRSVLFGLDETIKISKSWFPLRKAYLLPTINMKVQVLGAMASLAIAAAAAPPSQQSTSME